MACDKVSIHAPGEGSDNTLRDSVFAQIVSIHAPGEGSDFLAELRVEGTDVSIHAPGEGSDDATIRLTGMIASFNPRSR